MCGNQLRNSFAPYWQRCTHSLTEELVFPLGVGIALLALVMVGAGLFIDPIQTTSAGRGF